VDFVVAKPFKREQIREMVDAALSGVADQRSFPSGT